MKKRLASILVSVALAALNGCADAPAPGDAARVDGRDVRLARDASTTGAPTLPPSHPPPTVVQADEPDAVEIPLQTPTIEDFDVQPIRAGGEGAAPVRVAVLHLGRPRHQAEYARNILGIQVTAESLRSVVPTLVREGVEVVVLDVNLQGGFWSEAQQMHETLEKEYLPRFRTVAWINEAVSAAAMSMVVIPELYFRPAGIMGACPGWARPSLMANDVAIDPALEAMEAAAARAGHEFKVIRSMALAQPLSVRLDENGAAHWEQSEREGQVLNRAGKILTLNASDAVRYAFAKGIARDVTELASVLGLGEIRIVGDSASRALDAAMAEARTDESRAAELIDSLRTAMLLADCAIEGPERNTQAEAALASLNELTDLVKKNRLYSTYFAADLRIPNDVGGLNKVWFDAIRRGIDRLRRRELPLDEVAENVAM